MTPTQCRAARSLLDWSQSELAKKANLSESTVRDYEKGRRVPSANNLSAIRHALRAHGVMVIEDGESSPIGGEGVRFTADSTAIRLEDQIDRLLAEINSMQKVKKYLDNLLDSETDQTALNQMTKMSGEATSEIDRMRQEVDHLRMKIDTMMR